MPPIGIKVGSYNPHGEITSEIVNFVDRLNLRLQLKPLAPHSAEPPYAVLTGINSGSHPVN